MKTAHCVCVCLGNISTDDKFCLSDMMYYTSHNVMH